MKKISKHQLIMLVLQAEIELEQIQAFEQNIYGINDMVRCIDCVHDDNNIRHDDDDDDDDYQFEGAGDAVEGLRVYTWYIPRNFEYTMPSMGCRLIVSNRDATASVCAISDVYLISKKTHLQNGHPYKPVIGYDDDYSY